MYSLPSSNRDKIATNPQAVILNQFQATAGNGKSGTPTTAGGATGTSAGTPTLVTYGKKGTFYFADQSKSNIYKVEGGSLSLYAGNFKTAASALGLSGDRRDGEKWQKEYNGQLAVHVALGNIESIDYIQGAGLFIAIYLVNTSVIIYIDDTFQKAHIVAGQDHKDGDRITSSSTQRASETYLQGKISSISGIYTPIPPSSKYGARLTGESHPEITIAAAGTTPQFYLLAVSHNPESHNGDDLVSVVLFYVRDVEEIGQFDFGSKYNNDNIEARLIIRRPSDYPVSPWTNKTLSRVDSDLKFPLSSGPIYVKFANNYAFPLNHLSNTQIDKTALRFYLLDAPNDALYQFQFPTFGAVTAAYYTGISEAPYVRYIAGTAGDSGNAVEISNISSSGADPYTINLTKSTGLAVFTYPSVSDPVSSVDDVVLSSSHSSTGDTAVVVYSTDGNAAAVTSPKVRRVAGSGTSGRYDGKKIRAVRSVLSKPAGVDAALDGSGILIGDSGGAFVVEVTPTGTPPPSNAPTGTTPAPPPPPSSTTTATKPPTPSTSGDDDPVTKAIEGLTGNTDKPGPKGHSISGTINKTTIIVIVVIVVFLMIGGIGGLILFMMKKKKG